MNLLIGDRVRLTDRAAQSANNGFYGMRRSNPIDWRRREGTIFRGNSAIVQVKWDDRTSLDQWPVQALEKVEP